MAETVGLDAISDEQQDDFTISHLGAGGTDSQENLFKPQTEECIFKRKYYHRNVTIALIITIIALLIAIIILLCGDAKKPEPLAICNSTECIRSAANLKLSMDVSVDPCDDFHRFACGKWSEQHIDHGWYSKFSSWEEIAEHALMKVLKFLESESKSDEPLPVRQTRDFYKACTDVVTLDKLLTSSLNDYLKQVGLPVTPTFFATPENATSDFKFDWVKVDVSVKRTIAKDLFIPFYMGHHALNRSANVVKLRKTRADSPLPSPFKGFPGGKYSHWYKRAIKMTIKILQPTTQRPLNDTQLTNAAEIIWNMTVATEEIAKNLIEADPRSTTVQGLQNLTDQRFIFGGKDKPAGLWRRYLTLLFENVSGVTLDLDKRDNIYYTHPDIYYVINMTYYLSTVPDVHVELYAWWLTVNALVINTNTEISEYIRQSTKSFNPITTDRLRNFTCAGLTAGFLPYAVSYGVADELFTAETKAKAEAMIWRLKLAFLERLESMDWIDDDETRAQGRKKMLEMLVLVGYPDWLFNKTTMEKKYFNITIRNDTYLENMISVLTYQMSRSLASIRETNERNWKKLPIIVNSYHVYMDNAINIPMVMFSYPLYHLGLESLNYGAIGTLLGHELTHGFDNIGRFYDKHGNFLRWWSVGNAAIFTDKTKCFIRQYNDYALPNTTRRMNGLRTLNENLADNGGLHTAYLAYKHLKETDGPEKRLPGFENYTSDQLFFLAFANSWCQTQSPEFLAKQIQTDIHSPNFARILGTLQNSDEFASAFNCPVGSPMNPERTKCRIW